MDLLKKETGIDVKSASSSIEEIVARQFVERQAKKRNISLPHGPMFADPPVARKSPGKGGKGPEPPKPAAPALRPRLVKAVARPAADAAAEGELHAAGEMTEPPVHAAEAAAAESASDAPVAVMDLPVPVTEPEIAPIPEPEPPPPAPEPVVEWGPAMAAAPVAEPAEPVAPPPAPPAPA